jgi:flagellar basal body-associated protein FliL
VGDWACYTSQNMDQEVVWIILAVILVVNVLGLIFIFFYKKGGGEKSQKDLEFLLKNIQGLESRLDSRYTKLIVA